MSRTALSPAAVGSPAPAPERGAVIVAGVASAPASAGTFFAAGFLGLEGFFGPAAPSASAPTPVPLPVSAFAFAFGASERFGLARLFGPAPASGDAFAAAVRFARTGFAAVFPSGVAAGSAFTAPLDGLRLRAGAFSEGVFDAGTFAGVSPFVSLIASP